MQRIQKTLIIPGSIGGIEALEVDLINSEKNNSENDIAIICHPHPQHEGTMYNKVVTTLAKVFFKAGVSSIRFNYRGVGKSEGKYDNAIGEIDDCLSVVNWVNNKYNNPRIWLVGFSFGAYISAKAAEQINPYRLISIAPAISSHKEYFSLNIKSPWLVIQGENDEVVDPNEVYKWYDDMKNKVEQDFDLIKIPESSHFFHGKLIELQKIIAEYFNF